jgi:asparagine synthase (glutamine-hydrolysing)
MLWTTPESLQEKLPLVHQTRDLAITADARLDNRDELMQALGLTGRPAMEIADSQLILAAYEKWGVCCPEKLLGDFAFAIWDGARQTVFSGRDHFGAKPFYYYASAHMFVFASEIKAIFSLPEVPRQLNEVRVADLLLVPPDDDPTMTFYQNIFRLPPAHTLTVSAKATRLQKYWSLDPSRDVRLGSDAEYAQAFRELFTEAVRCRLRSVYPVGSMLSGGLDSSSVASVAQSLIAQNGGQSLFTFSATFDQVPQSNERQYMRAVADKGGFEPYYFHADQMTPLAALDQMLWHHDEPSLAGNLYMHWGLYQPAQARGVRVLLDGYDGDTTVSHGDGYLVELASTGRWLTLAAEVRAHTRRANGPPWHRAVWYCILVYSPAGKRIRQVWRALHRRAPTPSRSPWSDILNPNFAQRIRIEERYQTQQRPQTEREDHFRLLTRALLSSTLEMLDRAASAFAIELRYPFFDRRLVEFCLALPSQQKLSRGWSRIVMRRAMTDILPLDVQWRSDKSDLRPGFKYALLTCDPERLEEWFLKSLEVIEEYANVTTLKEIYQRLISQQAGAEDGHTAWKAIVLARWLQLERINSK